MLTEIKKKRERRWNDGRIRVVRFRDDKRAKNAIFIDCEDVSRKKKTFYSIDPRVGKTDRIIN